MSQIHYQPCGESVIFSSVSRNSSSAPACSLLPLLASSISLLIFSASHSSVPSDKDIPSGVFLLKVWSWTFSWMFSGTVLSLSLDSCYKISVRFNGYSTSFMLKFWKAIPGLKKSTFQPVFTCPKLTMETPEQQVKLS